jgi:hypothetical protein
MKNKSLGKAVLALSSILEAGGSHFALPIDGGQGTIDVYAKLFSPDPTVSRISPVCYELPPARFVLEKDVYRPGEAIRGHLIWHSYESVKFKEMFLHLEGLVFQRVVGDIQPESEGVYANRWLVINKGGRIFGPPTLGELVQEDNPCFQPQKLKKNKIHIWAFEFKLPDFKLPCSLYSSIHSQCHYRLRLSGVNSQASEYIFDYLKEIYIVPPLELFSPPARIPTQLDVLARDVAEIFTASDWVEPNNFTIDWGHAVGDRESNSKTTSDLLVVDDEGKISFTLGVTPLPGAIAPNMRLKNFCLSVINHLIMTYRQPWGAKSNEDANWKCLPVHTANPVVQLSTSIQIKGDALEPVELPVELLLRDLNSIQSTVPDTFPELLESYNYLEISATLVSSDKPDEKGKKISIGKRPITIMHSRFLEHNQTVAPANPEMAEGEFRIVEVTDQVTNKVEFLVPDKLWALGLQKRKNLQSTFIPLPFGAFSFGPVLSSEDLIRLPSHPSLKWPHLFGCVEYDWPKPTTEQIRDPSRILVPPKLNGYRDHYIQR